MDASRGFGNLPLDEDPVPPLTKGERQVEAPAVGGDAGYEICAQMIKYGKTRGIRSGRREGDVSVYDASRLETCSMTGPPQPPYEGETRRPESLRRGGTRRVQGYAQMIKYGKTPGIRSGRREGDVSVYDASRLETCSMTGPPQPPLRRGGMTKLRTAAFLVPSGITGVRTCSNEPAYAGRSPTKRARRL